MAINKLKKINVRSPYYISVAKPVSEGGEGDEPDVVPTEPLTRSFDTTCGATVSVGTDVGIVKYTLSSVNKQLGDYSVTFSNIKVPIKYRIGHADNMPSYSTAGLDTYDSAWNTATGESPTLSSASANPNGVSATATYTSTQSDIDTYGSIITLEILQPLVVEGYSFVSSCPADVPEQEPTVTGFATVLTVSNSSRDGAFGTLKVNNITLGSTPTNRLDVTRYIFSDISPQLVPQPSTGNMFFIKDGANTFIGNTSGYDVSVSYLPENTLSRGDNIVTYEAVAAINPDDQVRLTVTRHPVLDVNGTSYILGNGDGVTLQYIEYFFAGRGINKKVSLYFTGGNTNEFTSASYVTEKRDPYQPEIGRIEIFNKS